MGVGVYQAGNDSYFAQVKNGAAGMAVEITNGTNFTVFAYNDPVFNDRLSDWAYPLSPIPDWSHVFFVR